MPVRRGQFQRKPPSVRVQLNTRIDLHLADRFYQHLERKSPAISTNQAIADAIDMWLAAEERDTHAQPELYRRRQDHT